MSKSKYILTICLLCSILTLHAQDRHEDHHHGLNEIGVSTGAMYGIDDKVWGPSIHVHYFRQLGEHSRWAIGGFAEQAWLDHSHFALGGGVRFEIIDRLHASAFPGITFAKHTHDEQDGHDGYEDKSEINFVMHTELVYDLFHWDKFHIGPVVDYAWSKDDSHFMLGVHMAYSF